MGVTGNGGGGGTTGGGEAKVNGSATKLLEAPPVVSTSNMITATWSSSPCEGQSTKAPRDCRVLSDAVAGSGSRDGASRRGRQRPWMSSLHYQYISLMGNVVTVLRSTDWRISGIQNLKSSLVGPMLDWPKYNLISKEVLRQRLGTVSDLCSRCGDRKNECFCCWPSRNFCISNDCQWEQADCLPSSFVIGQIDRSRSGTRRPCSAHSRWNGWLLSCVSTTIQNESFDFQNLKE